MAKGSSLTGKETLEVLEHQQRKGTKLVPSLLHQQKEKDQPKPKKKKILKKKQSESHRACEKEVRWDLVSAQGREVAWDPARGYNLQLTYSVLVLELLE